MQHLSIEQRQQIQHLIRECGQQACQFASDQIQVYKKGVEDYVTSVDRLLDQQLTAQFVEWFPDHGIITEENAASWQTFATQPDRLWLIDPLDGTDDFIESKPHYAVMVGLLQQYQPIAGWVYAPVFDQMYFGGRDWGLFQATGDRVEPLIPQELAPPSAHFCPIILGYKDQRRYGQFISHLIPAAQFSCIGSFGLKVLKVICGDAGLYVYLNGRVKLWDTTGPLALAQAAGLVCCDLSGKSIQFTPDVIEGDTLIHQQPIVVGWASYIETLLPSLQEAVSEYERTL